MKEKITFASIEPTNICNLECVTCSRTHILRKFPGLKVGSISLGFLDKIKEALPDLNEIKFHGMGEPFLAEDTVLLHKKIRKLYPKANLISITNAAIPNFPLRVKDYLNHIIISVDHAQKEMLEKLRRNINYDLLVSNVKKLTQKNTSHQPYISINCCFSAHTYRDLRQVIIFAKDLGVNDVRCNLVQNWVHDNSFDTGDLDLNNVKIDSLAAAILHAFKIADELGVKMRIIGNPFFKIEDCVWARRMIYITKDGQIAPCCMRTEPTHYFGSFLDKPFKDIWQGDDMHNFRNDRINGHYPSACRNCPYLLNAAILRKLEQRKVPLTNDFLRHEFKD